MFSIMGLFFAVMILGFVVKVLGLAFRAAWGIGKFFAVVVFFPIMLVVMVVVGLMKIALPLLIVGVILSLVLPKLKDR